VRLGDSVWYGTVWWGVKKGNKVGPRVIMGMVWSGTDQNLGLQARVISVCRTGAPHHNYSTTTIEGGAASVASVERAAVS
jgi:hypothetical protein